jgi:hypothetical protein
MDSGSRPAEQKIHETFISVGKKMGVGGIHLSSQLWLRLMVQVGRGYKARPYLKNNQSKKGWQHALSGRVLDYESPEFDHQ